MRIAGVRTGPVEVFHISGAESDIIIIIIIIIITIELSLGGSSPYTSTDKTKQISTHQQKSFVHSGI